MFTPGFDPMLQYKEHHMELIREAQRHNLVKEALKARASKSWTVTEILALVGKGLVAIGTRLEGRQDRQPCGEAAMSQHGLNISV